MKKTLILWLSTKIIGVYHVTAKSAKKSDSIQYTVYCLSVVTIQMKLVDKQIILFFYNSFDMHNREPDYKAEEESHTWNMCL
jgi:hypothetical protein